MYVPMTDEEIDGKAKAVVKSITKGKQKLFDLEMVKEAIKKDNIADELITYAKIMEQGTWSAQDYINAVRYASFQSMGYSKSDSFRFTFPQYADKDKYPSTVVSKFTNKWDKTKIVTEIRKIALIQPYLLHQDLAEEALHTNADLMRNARSEMVRHQAAKSIMEYLRIPEDNHLTVDVNVKKDNSAVELEHTLMKLAKGQLDLVESGKATNKQITEMDIIEVQVDE